jgi:glycerol-1-phosphate dehydrogenase [NAD(P)+]
MQLTVPTLLRIKPDATHRLGKYLSQPGWRYITVLLAGNLTDWASQVLTVAFASASITVLHQQDVTSNDLHDLTPLVASIPGQTQAIVAIGGGRVIDGAKYAGHVLSLPVVAVPTAISNDGFASPFSSVVINGQA